LEVRQTEDIGIGLGKSEIAYRCFVDTCKTTATREIYTLALSFFMSYLKLPPGAYDRLLDKDPKLIQMDICDFITHLKKHGKSWATVATYTAALHKFFVQNDVTTLNWKKIKSYFAEHEKVAEDRPYNHSEVRTLLQHSSLRDRAMIMCMAHGGLRAGALADLRLRDLVPIEVDGLKLYKIIVYKKSKKSSYFSFLSPEACTYVEMYLDHRRRWSERLTDDSPLFRTDYNPQADDRAIKPISTARTRRFVRKALRDCGFHPNTVPLEGKPFQRNIIMANHGFRKFFESNAFKAGMDLMYIRRLMGQKSNQLEESYLNIPEEDLLKGDSKHVGYIGIIDQLTIDESQKLRRENQTLKVNMSSLEMLRAEVENLKSLLTKD
jgi:integrase